VYGKREGGVIIVVDAENARKGVAKTSAAVALADAFARRFGYNLTPDDGVLSGKALRERYEQHPGAEQPSVVVWDEAVGGGSGDKYRSTTNENVILGRAWQVLRAKRVVTLTTLPDWGDLVPRLKKLADYRVWCRDAPKIGEFQAYKAGTKFDGGKVKTIGLPETNEGAEPITFPDASADYGHVGDPDSDAHPLYESLSEKKGELTDTDEFDAGAITDTSEAAADGGVDPQVREEIEESVSYRKDVESVIRAVKPWDSDAGMSRRDAATLVDYEHNWVSERVREWSDEYEWRELVSDPTGG
jgi:hypothetical protein